MRVLGDLGEKEAAATLVNTLQNPDKKARKAAAMALDKLNLAPAREHASRADYLLAKDEWNRLDEIGARALDALIRALNYKDRNTCRKAAEALGKIQAQNAVPALEEAMSHPDKGVQKAARVALERIAAAHRQ